MTHVRPTILDTARSVARLDEHADIAPTETVKIDGQNWTGAQLRNSVWQNLGYQIDLRSGSGSWSADAALKRVTVADVRAILVQFGASQFTVEQHARAIAAGVRGMANPGGRS